MSDTSPSHRVADAIVLVAVLPVLALPLLIGGVHPQVMTAFAVFELLTLTAWVVVGVRDRRPITVSWLALPFVLGALFTAVEVLPLPSSLLTLLAPAPTAMRAFVVAGLPETARAEVLSVISMDPPETKAALARLIGAAAMFVIVSNAARRRERARLLWRFVVFAGAALFVVAIGHAILDVGAWGMFSRHSGVIAAPIVNQNHQSKIFAAFALLCFGRALACRGRREAVITGVVGILCAIAVALTLSRGGMLAFAAAALLGGALVWRARHVEDDDRQLNHLALPALAGAMILVVVGVLAIADRAVLAEVESLGTDVERLDASKIALWSPALSLLDEHAIVGTGNNAFAMAFTARSVPHTMYDAELTFSHVENIVVGTLVEHGAVLGGVLVLLGLLIGVRLLQALKTQADIAAVPAVFVLVVGDVVDFALESSAGIAMMALALGLCAAALPRSGWRLRPAPAVAVVTVAAALLVVHAPTAIADWRYRLDERLQRATVAERLPLLQHILAARPFDGFVCANLAVDARQRRQPREALSWANRAINLWPTLPAAHLEAARALVATGRAEQAMLEYREAARGTDGATIRVLQEVFAQTRDATLRRRALPEGTWPLSLLCRALVREKRPAEALVCAQELASHPLATASQKLEPIRQALERNDDAALKEALPALRAKAATSAADAALCAQVIARLHGDPEALAESARLLSPATTSTPELLQWRLATQARLQRFDDAFATLAALRRVQRTTRDHDALDRQEAALLGRAGQHARRLIVLQRLSTRHASDVDLLGEVGLAEVALGRESAALKTWRRIRALRKTTPTTTALAKALGLEAESSR